MDVSLLTNNEAATPCSSNTVEWLILATAFLVALYFLRKL